MFYKKLKITISIILIMFFSCCENRDNININQKDKHLRENKEVFHTYSFFKREEPNIKPEMFLMSDTIESLSFYGYINSEPFQKSLKMIPKIDFIKGVLFSFCFKDELPELIFNLHNIEELRISNCNLKNIDSEIFNLKKLKKLSLTDTIFRLDSFPKNSNLVDLSIYCNNYLKYIDKSISNLMKLQKLAISINSLENKSEFYNSISKLKNLKYIYIDDHFKEVPNIFDDMNNLKVINLLSCFDITNINPDIVKGKDRIICLTRSSSFYQNISSKDELDSILKLFEYKIKWDEFLWDVTDN